MRNNGILLWERTKGVWEGEKGSTYRLLRKIFAQAEWNIFEHCF